MPCAILTWILAGAALASGRPATDSLVFKRTYADGEKLVYHGIVTMSGSDMKLDSIVKVTVARKTLDAKPKITVVSATYQSTGTGVLSSPKPRDLALTLGANNLPDDLQMKKGDNSLFPTLFIAAMTADKSIDVGQEFPVSWSSKGDIPVGIKGTGKLTGLNPAAKTAGVTWTYALSVGGMDVGACTLKCVFDVGNCSLKSCEGTLMNGMFSISIKRQ